MFRKIVKTGHENYINIEVYYINADLIRILEGGK